MHVDQSVVLAVVLWIAVVVLLRRRALRPRARPRARPLGRLLPGPAITVPMTLCSDGRGEALVLDVDMAGSRTLFLLDTAYAGAPVVSLSYLAAAPFLSEQGSDDVCVRWREAIARLRRGASDDAQRAALGALLEARAVRAFTSGCTMRLMGIASTVEQHADLLLGPQLVFDADGTATHPSGGDVFVTHPLPGNVHILTIDYLLHRAPCVLRIADGTLTFRADPADAADFDFLAPVSVGGALAVPMRVGGSSQPLSIVVDTGATASLSLSPRGVAKLRRCTDGVAHVYQSGVNGDSTCSHALEAAVEIGPVALGTVQVFVNDKDVEGADGYAGLALLRALDLWFEPRRLGVRRNANEPARIATAAGGCPRRDAPLPACAAGG